MEKLQHFHAKSNCLSKNETHQPRSIFTTGGNKAIRTLQQRSALIAALAARAGLERWGSKVAKLGRAMPAGARRSLLRTGLVLDSTGWFEATRKCVVI